MGIVYKIKIYKNDFLKNFNLTRKNFQRKPNKHMSSLTNPVDFRVENLDFSKPVAGNIPNNPVSFHRISLGIKTKDGGRTDLIIPTSMHNSIRDQENTGDSGAINGNSAPICMWNRDGATPEEKRFTDVLDEITEACKEHLLENKDEIGKYDLENGDLKKLNPLWYKREKGKIVEGRGPVLYPKLIVSKKDGGMNILTQFVDDNTDNDIDPLELIGKHMHIQAAVKIESIFVGNKISLQIKLQEAVVQVVGQTRRRLLTTSVQRDTTVSTSNPLSMNDVKQAVVDAEDNDSSDEESENESNSDISESEEEKVVEKPAAKRKVVRKKVVKK